MNTRHKHRLIEKLFLLGIISYSKYNYVSRLLGVDDILIPV